MSLYIIRQLSHEFSITLMNELSIQVVNQLVKISDLGNFGHRFGKSLLTLS